MAIQGCLGPGLSRNDEKVQKVTELRSRKRITGKTEPGPGCLYRSPPMRESWWSGPVPHFLEESLRAREESPQFLTNYYARAKNQDLGAELGDRHGSRQAVY